MRQSVPSCTVLADAPSIIVGEDQMNAAIASLDLIRDQIANIENGKLRQLRENAALLERHIIEQLELRRATSYPHPDFEVVLQRRMEFTRDFSLLATLKGKVPDDELAPALGFRQPDPEWYADARKLGAIARKYGKTHGIADIIERGLAKVPIGAPKLVITQRSLPKVVS